MILTELESGFSQFKGGAGNSWVRAALRAQDMCETWGRRVVIAWPATPEKSQAKRKHSKISHYAHDIRESWCLKCPSLGSKISSRAWTQRAPGENLHLDSHSPPETTTPTMHRDSVA